MTEVKKPEVWLRGPLPGILPALQPVAHALLQALEEVTIIMKDFPDPLLWKRSAGMASVGFHLQHMKGVLDRLFTYAEDKMLTSEQLQALSEEGQPRQNLTTGILISHFNQAVNFSLDRIKNTPEHTLYHSRGVGRAQIPSTVFGLMVHAAEHTMRHLGQLLVTAAVVKETP